MEIVYRALVLRYDLLRLPPEIAEKISAPLKLREEFRRWELRGARSRSDILLIRDGAERVKYRDSAVVRRAGTAKLLIRVQREGPTPRLPPSALLLRKIMEERGPLTALEIVSLTGLSPRTVRHALERLRSAGLVRSVVDPTDPRRRVYMA
ncbi:MAG: helix-turn-helix transcriptional regulator [Pyrobaculum sp.]|nr:helix-turn-helix transcriptional regulator [Pyrobaculum sp.]